ncbi:protein MALE DISCOVERER 2 isoform X2 [Elaeis guineensis]|uniref:Protein MALE DISCOVERER 2 isoform X2 n=1 Tax=Elaeis guineensis var. tenera TaxID=51953 RepID=A0A6J0PFY7_ELAGV|nr:protein MALE DISCOVERER 2 isoform X2 [Elaeis guineensis]
MGGRWSLFELQLYKFLWVVLMLHLHSDECLSLNLEGLALLEFRSKVEADPYGALENWDPLADNPCDWSGVHCIDGKVEIFVLYKNNFSGAIPKEIGGLTMLELMDLRSNNLSGRIPVEIGEMLSLKCLLLSDNKFQDGKLWIEKLNMLSEMECNRSHSGDVATEIGRINRKVGRWVKFKRGFPAHYHRGKQCIDLSSFTEPYLVENAPHIVNSVRRKLLEEAHNLPAAPVEGAVPQESVDVPSIGTGSFQAVPQHGSVKDLLAAPASTSPHTKGTPPKKSNTNDNNTALSGIGKWAYILILPGIVLLLTITGSIFMCRRQGGRKKGPWKTGLTGQLQKALITGVPKLQRSELEAACEDFSNILNSYPDCTMFKGTLSSGVEIAAISTNIASAIDWSRRSEMRFRRKIDTLSRVNHKNFVNLIGYCKEDEPFMRMMVFEYAPNGTLFDHLHVKVFEPLDWGARMRIIMGIAYCLQYMYHELNPPVSFPVLQSNSIFLTDDYAAKIADLSMWKEFTAAAAKRNASGDDPDLPESPLSDPGTNVYSFGLLMLEIISGKLPYSEEQGSLLNWATEYLNDKHNIRHLVDPTLKNYKDKELDIVCEEIQECIHPDPKHRPNMKEITAKLREVLAISPDAATPRLSPLWWAELEILSMEAS